MRAPPAMLKPRPYPAGQRGLAAAQQAGGDGEGRRRSWRPAVLPPLNVSFDGRLQPGRCLAARLQPVRRLLLGLQHRGQKHHADELPARRRGVRRRDLLRRSGPLVEKLDDGGWSVAYDPIGLGAGQFDAEPLRVRADIVVLAAGTLGSTEILLRSRAQGLALSPALGSRFSGNGDVLAFGYNNDQPIDGIGFGWRAAAYDWTNDDDSPVGPTHRRPDRSARAGDGAANVEHGMVIEEGAIPGAMANLHAGADGRDAPPRSARDTDPGRSALGEGARGRKPDPRAPITARSTTPRPSWSCRTTAPAAARWSSRGRPPRMRLARRGELPGFQRVAANLEKAVKATGGTYVPNPIWTECC